MLAIVLLVLAGCGRGKSEESHNGPEADVVSIGAAYPMAVLDKSSYYRWALETAAEEVNKNGGVLGKPLSIVFRDDKNDARTAMQIAETFHNMGITAVIGHWSSDVCYYVEDIYEERGIVMITPGANGRLVFEQEFQNIFRIIPDDNVYARAMAEYAVLQGFRSMVIYYSENTYGSSMAMAMERELAQRGIMVLDRISGISPVNASTVMRRWRAFGCDGVIAAADVSVTTDVLTRIRDAGIMLPVFLTSSSFRRRSFEETMAGYIDRVYMFEHGSDLSGSDFVKNYSETWNDYPSVCEIAAYAAVHLLVYAMNTCRTLDSRYISAWLKNINRYPTITGILSYNRQTQEFDGQYLQVKQLGRQ
ncbi:MAG: ABC transporter substrate-binding protein [Spirochaetaceae bacterium]|nr:ABC transporter substrate-binding protein [Spirochaetaceae bacterium]